MLQFQGTEDLPRPQSEVWPYLSDAGQLVEFVPDRESVQSTATDEALCTVRPAMGFMRGTLEMTVRILERQPESGVRVSFLSKGVGATSEVEVAIRLEPLDEGTRVQWTAEIKQLTGLLKMVPQGLVRGAAQKVVGDVWANVGARLRT